MKRCLKIILFFCLAAIVSGCASGWGRGGEKNRAAERRERRLLRRASLKKGRAVKKETVELDINRGEENILIMGPEKRDARESVIYTFSGSFTTYSLRGTEFGASVAAGDLNGDGIPDIIAGAPNRHPDESNKVVNGKAYAIFMEKNSPDILYEEDYSAAVSEGENRSAADTLGRSVAAGDLNGDGIDDMIVGAPSFENPSNGQQTGAVLVYYGKKEGKGGETGMGGKEADAVIYGSDAEDLTGYAVAVKDINGDGNADLIIGAPGADGMENRRAEAGEVSILFGGLRLKGDIQLKNSHDVLITGRESSGIGFFSFAGEQENAGESVGSAVTAGDINSDGINDIIIGAPGADAHNGEQRDAGRVYVVFGKKEFRGTIDLRRDADLSINGEVALGNAGYAVAAGDVTGDGREDVIISAPFARMPRGEEKSGAVYVVNGGITQRRITLGQDHGLVLRGRPVYTKKGLLTNKKMDSTYFGHSLAVGDFNGDRIKDIAIGSPGTVPMESSNRIMAGEVEMVYGSADLEGEHQIRHYADLVIYGGRKRDLAGNSVYMRDMNRDGLDDLLIGAPGARGETKNVYNNGEIYVFYGRN